MPTENLDIEIARGTTFGPIAFNCRDEEGNPVPLAGWSAMAEIRKDTNAASAMLDLAPLVAADDAIGVVTIPEVHWSVTAGLPACLAIWDLILQDPYGRRVGPIIGGRVSISTPSTQKP